MSAGRAERLLGASGIALRVRPCPFPQILPGKLLTEADSGGDRVETQMRPKTRRSARFARASAVWSCGRSHGVSASCATSRRTLPIDPAASLCGSCNRSERRRPGPARGGPITLSGLASAAAVAVGAAAGDACDARPSPAATARCEKCVSSPIHRSDGASRPTRSASMPRRSGTRAQPRGLLRPCSGDVPRCVGVEVDQLDRAAARRLGAVDAEHRAELLERGVGVLAGGLGEAAPVDLDASAAARGRGVVSPNSRRRRSTRRTRAGLTAKTSAMSLFDIPRSIAPSVRSRRSCEYAAPIRGLLSAGSAGTHRSDDRRGHRAARTCAERRCG